ncbi:hypothetical protein NDU88_004197 [Pleurodeles waltl]|uniref:Uncharacterized protein n=1 Tax=Pleurodeles waltl TaxID=8319 RepID=A0AAV7LKP8_PLEWA|nr:hypothetical protein NDU88_004197 [Pleurodeles waltl]
MEARLPQGEQEAMLSLVASTVAKEKTDLSQDRLSKVACERRVDIVPLIAVNEIQVLVLTVAARGPGPDWICRAEVGMSSVNALQRCVGGCPEEHCRCAPEAVAPVAARETEKQRRREGQRHGGRGPRGGRREM